MKSRRLHVGGRFGVLSAAAFNINDGRMKLASPVANLGGAF